RVMSVVVGRAPTDRVSTLIPRLVHSHRPTEPWMPGIAYLSRLSTMGVTWLTCITRAERILGCARMRPCRGQCKDQKLAESSHFRRWAACTIDTSAEPPEEAEVSSSGDGLGSAVARFPLRRDGERLLGVRVRTTNEDGRRREFLHGAHASPDTRLRRS